MRKTIILFLLIAFATTSFAQQQPVSNAALLQKEYLKTSKKQKMWAWISTGVGAVIIASTAAVQSTEDVYADIFGVEGTASSSYTIGYVIGGACVATGVVLFVASAKNKKKAAAVSVFIDIKKAPMLQQAVLRNQSFPSVGLRIGL